jgi:hypothetical protein
MFRFIFALEILRLVESGMPIFRKVERPISVIQNGVELSRKVCPTCEIDFYGTAEQTECDRCRKVDSVTGAVRPVTPIRPSKLPPAITDDRGYKSSSKSIPSSSGGRNKKDRKKQRKRSSKG